MSAISDALSTLSDRGLRRLLGARTFLRGLDYEKRKVVEDVDVNDSERARPRQGLRSRSVRGDDPARRRRHHLELHLPRVPEDRPALQARRGAAHHRAQPGARRAAAAAARRQAATAHQHNHQQHQHPARSTHQQPATDSKASRRRDRRRRAQAQQLAGAARPRTRRRRRTPARARRASAPGSRRKARVRALQLEFRVHVRQGGLTVTVLDVDSRVPLSAERRARLAGAVADAAIATRCACSRASRAATRVTRPSTSAAKTPPSSCRCCASGACCSSRR